MVDVEEVELVVVVADTVVLLVESVAEDVDVDVDKLML